MLRYVAAVALMVSFAAHAAQPKRYPTTRPVTSRPTTSRPARIPVSRPAKPAASKPVEQPLEITDAVARVKLAGPVDATGIGGGGRLLILHLKKLQMLGVFDVATSKVVKY